MTTASKLRLEVTCPVCQGEAHLQNRPLMTTCLVVYCPSIECRAKRASLFETLRAEIAAETAARQPKPRAKPGPKPRPIEDREACSKPKCSSPTRARGLCRSHYDRLLYRQRLLKGAKAPTKAEVLGPKVWRDD